MQLYTTLLSTCVHASLEESNITNETAHHIASGVDLIFSALSLFIQCPASISNIERRIVVKRSKIYYFLRQYFAVSTILNFTLHCSFNLFGYH